MIVTFLFSCDSQVIIVLVLILKNLYIYIYFICNIYSATGVDLFKRCYILYIKADFLRAVLTNKDRLSRARVLFVV